MALQLHRKCLAEDEAENPHKLATELGEILAASRGVRPGMGGHSLGAPGGIRPGTTSQNGESSVASRQSLPPLSPQELAAAGPLRGKEFEDFLAKRLQGEGSFKAGGCEFDGRVGNRWWEAKSGQALQYIAADRGKFRKFTSDMGNRRRIANQNGATYELISNTKIPDQIKEWLTSKGISFSEP